MSGDARQNCGSGQLCAPHKLSAQMFICDLLYTIDEYGLYIGLGSHSHSCTSTLMSGYHLKTASYNAFNSIPSVGVFTGVTHRPTKNYHPKIGVGGIIVFLSLSQPNIFTLILID